jgi:hypothetical protein
VRSINANHQTGVKGVAASLLVPVRVKPQGQD